MSIPLITHTAKLNTGETVYALDVEHPGVQEAVATTGDVQVCPLCMFGKAESCNGTPCYEEAMMEDRDQPDNLIDMSTITLVEGSPDVGYRSVIWVKDTSHIAMLRLGVVPPKD